MSLLWSERIVAYVGPVEIGAIHHRPGLRRATTHACLPAPSTRQGRPPLRELLATFAARPSAVDVLLASALVRFLVVPPNPEIDSPAERHAYAELLCERELGLLPESFVLQLSGGRLDEPAFACAIDRSTLQAILDDCGGADKVRAMIPLFVHAFNQVCQSLTTGALAIAEAGRLTLGIVTGTGWQAVASRVCEPRDTMALETMLSDYSPLLPEGGPCYLFDPEVRFGNDVPAPWTLHRIRAEHSSVALAACALVR